MKRRFVSAASIVGVLALVLTGCSGLSDATSSDSTSSSSRVPELGPHEKVSIVFESYNLSQAGPWSDTVHEMLNGFKKKYPNITVKAQPPIGGGFNATSSLQKHVLAGSPPDVSQLFFSDMDFIVNNMGPKNLDTLFGKKEVQKQFGGAQPFAKGVVGISKWDGKTYNIPYSLSTPVLYLNTSLFAKAGISPDVDLSTWAKAKDVALKIRSATNADGVYVDCLTVIASDWCAQSLIRSNGGYTMAPGSTQFKFGEKPAVEAIAKMQDLVKSGASPNMTQAQAQDAFKSGKLAMMLDSSAYQGFFKGGADTAGWDLGSAKMPGYTGHTAVPTNSGAGLMIFSKDPHKQRAAWDLVKYLTGPQAMTTIAKDMGYVPLRPSLVTDPHYLGGWWQTHKLGQPNLDQLKIVEPGVSYPTDSFEKIKNIFMTAVENVVYQGADPDSTLMKAQNQVMAIVK